MLKTLFVNLFVMMLRRRNKPGKLIVDAVDVPNDAPSFSVYFVDARGLRVNGKPRIDTRRHPLTPPPGVRPELN